MFCVLCVCVVWSLQFWHYLSHLDETNPAAITTSVIVTVILIFCSKCSQGCITPRSPWDSIPRPHGINLCVLHWMPASVAVPLTVPIPAELIVVILGESLSVACDLQGLYGIGVVGSIPTGLPPVQSLDWGVTNTLLSEKYMEIIVIALITIALTMSDGKTYAERFDRPLDLNREIATVALINMISPFFSCYIAGAGLSRSALATTVSNGHHLTQLYSVITAVIVSLMLLVLVAYLEALPKAVLGTVVIYALRGLVRKLDEGKMYWRLGKTSDFLIWLLTLLATIFLDLDYGLLIGLAFTIHSVFDRLARAKLTIQGRLPGTKQYIDINENDQAVELRGVKVVRLDTALFFGSRERLYDFIKNIVFDAQRKGAHVHTIVLNAGAVIFLDSAGISKLNSLARELRDKFDALLLVAECSALVENTLFEGEFHVTQPERKVIFPTVAAAVSYGVATNEFSSPGAPIRVESLHSFRKKQERITSDIFGRSELLESGDDLLFQTKHYKQRKLMSHYGKLDGEQLPLLLPSPTLPRKFRGGKDASRSLYSEARSQERRGLPQPKGTHAANAFLVDSFHFLKACG